MLFIFLWRLDYGLGKICFIGGMIFFFFFEGKELILIPNKSKAKTLTITGQALK
jgi:hypothetical protein